MMDYEGAVMKNANWFLEQCLNCTHLITKTNMNTGKKTYACDNGTTIMTNYKSFKYVDENDVVVPSSKGAETMCESFAERFMISLNQ
jgi:hypothetical protein